MKNILFLLLTICCLNCSSDDDATTLDTNLLYGQWYRVGLCQEQNSLLLNPNKTYVILSSGAVNCDDPEPDTYQFTGAFTIQGDVISYNQLTADLIIDGTDLTTLEFPNPDIVNEVNELSETTLIIRTYIDRGNNVTEELGLATFEH
ncbi:hypothetical protein SAMN04515667_1266 [Formosa sp. Hel1_31_208]|uniref:hypothetical protein n=1 Tax=Formosa sp. Hel1_31_208 TaxID=1798225 RepID=UPI00087D1DAD|nr:hypothetical protein [Formosa sp. Hel1_31_208]SDS03774.1 hypothetical protein SAMN04515667_1266 [Formosa sp. Hel1_31_208]